jgi:hypothetical protein
VETVSTAFKSVLFLRLLFDEEEVALDLLGFDGHQFAQCPSFLQWWQGLGGPFLLVTEEQVEWIMLAEGVILAL